MIKGQERSKIEKHSIRECFCCIKDGLSFLFCAVAIHHSPLTIHKRQGLLLLRVAFAANAYNKREHYAILTGAGKAFQVMKTQAVFHN